MSQRTPNRPKKNPKLPMAFLVISALALALAIACASGGATTPVTVVALLPSTVTAGQPAQITVSVQKDLIPAQATLNIVFTSVDNRRPMLTHQDQVHGTKAITLRMPNEPGNYRVDISGLDQDGRTFSQQGWITAVETSFMILQTDRPTYRPGDKLRMRAIVLNRDLKPVQADVKFRVRDAEMASVHLEEVSTGPFGIADSQMPISNDPRTGDWTVDVFTGDLSDEVTVLVDNYALPRYQVTVLPDRERINGGSSAQGRVATDYTHGGPASGLLTLTPQYRKQGTDHWIKGVSSTVRTAGDTPYSYPAAEDWTGHIRIDAEFKENPLDEGRTSSAYHRVTPQFSRLLITPGGNTIRPGLPFSLAVSDPQWTEADSGLEPWKGTLTVSYTTETLTDHTILADQPLAPLNGTAHVTVDVPESAAALTILATDDAGNESLAHLAASHSTTGRYIQLIDSDPGIKDPGDEVQLNLHANHKPGTIHWQASSKGAVITSGLTHTDRIELTIDRRMSPKATILAYAITSNGEVLTAQTDLQVAPAFPLEAHLAVSPENPRPGDLATITVTTQGPALVSLAGADRATHVLAGRQLDMLDILNSLSVNTGTTWNAASMLQQHRKRHTHIPNPGSDQLLEASGITVISNSAPQGGRTIFSRNPDGAEPQDNWGARNIHLVTRLAKAPWALSPDPDDASSLNVAIVIAATATAAALILITLPMTKPAASTLRRVAFKNVRTTIITLVVTPIILLALLIIAAFIWASIYNNLIIEPAGGSIGGNIGGTGSFYPAQDQTSPQTPATAWSPPDQPTGPGEAAAPDRVRNNFPQTWLWDLEYTDALGSLSLERIVPDSITSWDIRTLAMSQEHGIGIAETSVTVLQPLYLKAHVPPKAIRNETIPLNVTAYNHTALPQDVRITISAPPEMELKGIREQTVHTPAGGNATALFHITPTVAGEFPLQIDARGATHSDAIQVRTTVRLEGIPREDSATGTAAAGREAHFQVTTPDRYVEDSLDLTLQVTGSRMAKSLKNIGNHLTIPQGCGEQNMSSVGPNAQILLYALQLDHPPKAVIDRATLLMRTGYQRQLNYQRKDGSFSAFGDSDAQGSEWLTAYTIKTFAQTAEHIHVDQDVMDNAAAWLAQRQERDGRIPLTGRTVHNTELVDGTTALTAYVAIALLEADYNRTATAAVRYLETQLDNTMNTYTRTTSTLALVMAGSGRAEKALDLMLAQAMPGPEGTLSWTADGRSVEPTAYAAMALHLAGRTEQAELATLNLVSHQDYLGGFRDTHATAVAIEALNLTNVSPIPQGETLVLTIQAGETAHTVKLDRSNWNQVQELQIDPDVKTLTATAHGRGRAVLTLSTKYRQLPQSKDVPTPISLTIETSAATVAEGNAFTINAAVTYRTGAPVNPGMITIEIEHPTSTAPTPESLQKLVEDNARIMRADDDNGRTAVYIDWMGPGETIEFTYQMNALAQVKGREASAQAYAYYRPDIRTGASVPALTVVSP